MLQRKKTEPVKTLTLQEYIEYRNMLVIRREGRAKYFPSKKNYYISRIEQLDELYPEFHGIGVIDLKIEKIKPAYVQQKLIRSLNLDARQHTQVLKASQDLELKRKSLESSMEFKNKVIHSPAKK